MKLTLSSPCCFWSWGLSQQQKEKKEPRKYSSTQCFKNVTVKEQEAKNVKGNKKMGTWEDLEKRRGSTK